ncbi:(d)CMP kinase [Pajaroellobacter abortibovis]|uniref:Cytidylate kinase n=1 Tax=Pajaroellobacter abortibovis TaxID=1882918 RepID=A0A1L6MXF6_9BACT|nr:(d)CMP kinase [Pajaroellobacter abortibovis]APS00115.1 cytidylate kinase [Pajaroellobacter abortibovis]
MNAHVALAAVPQEKQKIVAIDGPAGAGKSTVAWCLASQLGFLFLDTGALYRAIAFYACEVELAWDNAVAVSELARKIVAEDALQLVQDQDPRIKVRVFLYDREITDAIRTPLIGKGASFISVHPHVRESLLDLQRQLGAREPAVAEGRDIGTIVFSQAAWKFFLTAQLEVRAARRFAELTQQGIQTTFESVLQQMKDRDEKDAARACAPLCVAEDAVVIDTSELTQEETLACFIHHIQRP